jgi:hypothetical protein
MISEDVLRKLTPDERASVRRTLAALDAELAEAAEGSLPSSRGNDRRRRRFVALMTIASVTLIPWIVVLAVTLPRRYVAGHWTLTWVGFDVMLLGSLAATAWLAWQRRQVVVLAAFTTGTLLACDAWFDVTTASGRTDTVLAIATAVLAELPLAALLFAVAYHLLQLTVQRMQAAQGAVDATVALLKIPLFGVPPTREPRRREPVSR